MPRGIMNVYCALNNMEKNSILKPSEECLDENGKKEYKGILEGFDEGYIKIKEENQEFKIERKNISQIKTDYNWD